MARSIGISIPEPIGNPELLKGVRRGELKAGPYALNDILEELKNPGGIRASASWRRRSTIP
jgi:hypothetical protein